jgi:hypothetical protein
VVLNAIYVVDDFRHLSFQLMHTHFKEAVDSQRAGRIEFLPVSWHKALHGEGGIDQKLKPITLKSIPKLRNFTNDTLLDILFYTSPVYAQVYLEISLYILDNCTCYTFRQLLTLWVVS